MNPSSPQAAQPADLLIANTVALTLAPDRPVITPAHIVIHQGRLAAIEEDSAALANYDAARTLDGQGRLVMPGLVNTHLHERPMRGVGDGLPVLEWHSQFVDVVASRMTPEDAYLGAQLAYAELVRAGTTSVLVMCVHPEAEAEAASDFGIRARLVPHAETDADLEAYELILRRGNARLSGDRVRLWQGMELPAYHSDAALRRVAGVAKEEGVGIHTHFSEFRRDEVSQLQRTNLLGPHVSLAHCVWIEAEDIAVLAETQTNVVHNPKSNLRFGNGIAPVIEMLAAGVNVSLGTDGPMSSHRLDVFEELRTASLLQRGHHRNAELVPALQALHMATSNGARTLGLQGQVGRLQPGMKADIVMLNTQHPSMSPLLHDKSFSNVATLAAFCASAAVVDTVIVDGKILLEAGRLTTVDENDLLARVKRRAQALLL